jgi:magnesium-protoporphyrin O-methyltransferase
MLAVMHRIGRLFPRSDRSPSLEPVLQSDLLQGLSVIPELGAWQSNRTQRISRGFYKSQAWEWIKP